MREKGSKRRVSTCADDGNVGMEWDQRRILGEMVEGGDKEQRHLVDRILQLCQSVHG